jgi:hypothetical protein
MDRERPDRADLVNAWKAAQEAHRRAEAIIGEARRVRTESMEYRTLLVEARLVAMDEAARRESDH